MCVWGRERKQIRQLYLNESEREVFSIDEEPPEKVASLVNSLYLHFYL